MYNRHTYWAGLFRLPIAMENQVSTDNLGTVGPIWLILLTDPLEIKNSAQEWIYQPSKTWVCAGAQLLHDAQSTFWLILAYFGQNVLFMGFFFFIVWKFLALAGIEKRQRGHILTKNSCEFTPMKNAKKKQFEIFFLSKLYSLLIVGVLPAWSSSKMGTFFIEADSNHCLGLPLSLTN